MQSLPAPVHRDHFGTTVSGVPALREMVKDGQRARPGTAPHIQDPQGTRRQRRHLPQQAGHLGGIDRQEIQEVGAAQRRVCEVVCTQLVPLFRKQPGKREDPVGDPAIRLPAPSLERDEQTVHEVLFAHPSPH